GRRHLEQKAAGAIEHAERVVVRGQRIAEIGERGRLAPRPLEQHLVLRVGREVSEEQLRLAGRSRQLARGARGREAASGRIARLAEGTGEGRAARAGAAAAGLARRAVVAIAARGTVVARGMLARSAPGAPVERARIAVARARRPRRGEAGVGGLV